MNPSDVNDVEPVDDNGYPFKHSITIRNVHIEIPNPLKDLREVYLDYRREELNCKFYEHLEQEVAKKLEPK